jgi:hypothetical protein
MRTEDLGDDFVIVSDSKTGDHRWRVSVRKKLHVVDENVVAAHPLFDEKMKAFERGGVRREDEFYSEDDSSEDDDSEDDDSKENHSEEDDDSEDDDSEDDDSEDDDSEDDDSEGDGDGEEEHERGDEDGKGGEEENDREREGKDNQQNDSRSRTKRTRTPYDDDSLILQMSTNKIFFGKNPNTREIYRDSLPTFRRVYETNPWFYGFAKKVKYEEYVDCAKRYIVFVNRIKDWETRMASKPVVTSE